MTRSTHAVFIALAVLGIYGPLTSTCLSQGIPLLGAGGRTVPSQAYDLAQNALASGNFSDALELAEQEYKGCMKFGADRWIDSTAAAAIVGECCFEKGRYRDAIGFYNEAIIRAASHGNWLEDIRFPSQPLHIKNSRPQQLWGQSPREIKISDLPDRMSIRLGTSDPQSVLQSGGVLAAPIDYPIRPQEVMRSLAISLYRRADLLGPMARDGNALEAISAWLQKRPAPQNHFSQAWIDVCLGIVYWSQARNEQALPLLKRGLLLEGQFDHPLTPWALLVGGRIALDAGQYETAKTTLEQATFAAAAQGDARALEESFRWSTHAHLAFDNTLPKSVIPAISWSEKQLRSLSLRLLSTTASVRAEQGNIQEAARSLVKLNQSLSSSELALGRCGAYSRYTAALIAYAAGNDGRGDAEYAKALTLARGCSARLFQTQLFTESLVRGESTYSDREASDLFKVLLADPLPFAIQTDPLDAIAVISTDRTSAFSAWLAVTQKIFLTNSRGDEAWLNAIENQRRNSWLTHQPLGGRRNNLLKLLTTTTGNSDELTALRKRVLARYPDVATNLSEINVIRSLLQKSLWEFRHMPRDTPVPDDSETWKDFAARSQTLENQIDFIAAGRNVIPLEFPPLFGTTEIRNRLVGKQRLLSFTWTNFGLFASLEAPKQAASWKVKRPDEVRKKIIEMTRSLSLYHPLRPVETGRLDSQEWQTHAAALTTLLFEDSGVSLERHHEFDELIIVPDGLLWYLPFELLAITTKEKNLHGATHLRLKDTCQIRYSPTRSLAVGNRHKATAPHIIAVQASLTYRNNSPEQSSALLERIDTAIENAVFLKSQTPKIPIGISASLADTLVIFDELSANGKITDRPLIAADAGRPGMSFNDWLAAPQKAARCAVLTGLQTQASEGLNKATDRPGNDLFMTAMDLLATGTETAVISRWNVGGRIGIDLGIEFIKDRQHEGIRDNLLPAAVSWQRAVDLVTAEQPDFNQEPRIKITSSVIPQDATHPFFWAGYTLIDCGILNAPEAPTESKVEQVE